MNFTEKITQTPEKDLDGKVLVELEPAFGKNN